MQEPIETIYALLVLAFLIVVRTRKKDLIKVQYQMFGLGGAGKLTRPDIQ